MAKFGKEIRVGILPDGEITLRRPDNRERSAHLVSLLDSKEEEKARVAFFDTLFLKVAGCEDETGPIPEDGKERIPADLKAEVILKFVENSGRIFLKN